MSVQYATKLLWVTRKTVHRRSCRLKYEWEWAFIPKKSGPKSWEAWNKICEDTECIVCDIAQQFKREWPMRLAIRLREEHWIVLEQTTIYRILKRRNVRYYTQYQKPKKIPKLYTHEVPWFEVQVDTSFPYGRHRKIIIYTAIDDCTRTIFTRSYNWYGIEQSKDFASRLVKAFPCAIQTIKTDQWREFWAWFTRQLETRWINHHKNDPYHPEQNGKVERYHKTLWDEEEHHRAYLASIDEINYNLWQWMKYYNTKRKHTWLWMNGLTPVQKQKKTIGISLSTSIDLNASIVY